MAEDALEWDDYFYKIALVVQEKSKDWPRVGAVVVRQGDGDNVIISTGFNGPARGVLDLAPRFEDSNPDDACERCGRGPMKEKLRWSCHAEANAIFNAARFGSSLQDCTIYTTKHPCVSCASSIVQAGIKRVYTEDPEPWKSDPYDHGDGSVSRQILSEGGVQFHQVKSKPR
jgi:dCMP deaminase